MPKVEIICNPYILTKKDKNQARRFGEPEGHMAVQQLYFLNKSSISELLHYTDMDMNLPLNYIPNEKFVNYTYEKVGKNIDAYVVKFMLKLKEKIDPSDVVSKALKLNFAGASVV